MTVKVNHTTPADGTFSAQGALAWDADHTLTGFGSMAEQNANNVNITGGSISGTTIGGVVTAVSGTAPIASSGGTTPAISIPQATGSVDGYLSATDWTTFNNKGNGTVTSVTGSAPVVSSGGTTPAISMAKATTAVDGYLAATDFTIFNGKVSSVSGTSPIVSSGGTTPAISIPQATGSVDGYLSATDWTTFNNKQPAGTYVTSVGATSPVTSSGGTTPTIAIPQANGSTSGYLSNTDWTTFNNKANSGANSDITSLSGITGPIATPTYVQFNTTQTPLPTDATGRLYYDSSDQFQTFVFQMNGNVVQHVGEEQFFRLKCQGAITKGQVVSFAGTLGASGGLIGKAATGLSVDQSNYILGIADESGANNDWIFVSYFGEVKNINTTGGAENWVQGDVLYYNPAVTGGLTKNKPAAPNPIAVVAAVVHVGSSNGILFVRPTFGSVLGGTDGNVQFGTLNNLDVIQYDSVAQYWKNVAATSLSVGYATTAGSATTATTANAVANDVTFNSTGGASPGTTFNGSAARTIDYSTVGAPKADGTGASGTWGINISGNAATATSATSATTATNATNIGVTDDTSTNADYYPVWVTANTGNLPAKVTSTKLKFNPSTGALTATGGMGGGVF